MVRFMRFFSRGLGLLQDTDDGSTADAVELGELSEALATSAVLYEGVAVDIEWRPAEALTFEPGAAHAGAHPLDDQVAFQLGDRAHDDHHGPAQRTAGVDVLAEANELDVEVVELIQHFQKVPDGAGHTIEGPDQHDIELAAPGIGHELVQTRPAGPGLRSCGRCIPR